MRKLPLPTDYPISVYDQCAVEVTEEASRLNYQSNRTHMIQAIADWDTTTADLTWFKLNRVPRGKGERIIAGTLTKDNLVDLYKTVMVGGNGPAREIYDRLLVAAAGFCPFCGGLGRVRTLDHFLPKSNFPLYSTLPANLVPSCRDCNTGKNASFGKTQEKQSLHPYVDHDKFFSERWVKAEVLRVKPILLRFYCEAPSEAGWSDLEAQRAAEHFRANDLAARYSLQAGVEAAKVVDQRRGALRRLDAHTFRETLLDGANTNSSDLNGWSRTTYAALAATDWFVELDFTDDNWEPPAAPEAGADRVVSA